MRISPQVTLLSTAIIVATCLAFATHRAEAASGAATLSWYPPTENADGSHLGNLVGYRIYYGKTATKLNKSITINNPGLTRYVVENLSTARWHFAISSINSAGIESQRSKTVSKRVG
jgi:hypothetical protein